MLCSTSLLSLYCVNQKGNMPNWRLHRVHDESRRGPVSLKCQASALCTTLHRVNVQCIFNGWLWSFSLLSSFFFFFLHWRDLLQFIKLDNPRAKDSLIVLEMCKIQTSYFSVHISNNHWLPTTNKALSKTLKDE